MDAKAWITDPNRTYKDGLVIYNKIKRNKHNDAFFNSVSDAAPGSLHYNLLLQNIQSAYRILLAMGKADESVTVSVAVKKPLPSKEIGTKTLSLRKTAGAKPGEPSLVAAKPKLVYNELVDVKSLPEDLQQKYFRNQAITREVSGLHQELKNANTDKDRMVIAANIDELFNERKTNWTAIDTFMGVDYSAQTPRNENTEAAPIDTEPSGKQLAKEVLTSRERLRTVKINISRVEKELQNPKDLTPAKIRSRKSRIKAWNEEKQELEEFLSQI